MISYRQIWIIALIAKLALGALLPLSNDEAYYWVWGQHLQWSYFDHPPFVAALMWLAKPFEFLGAERWPNIILGHSSLLLIRTFFAHRISETDHKWLLIAFLVSPFFGVGSILVTPDAPHVFTWLLALLALQTHWNSPTHKSAVYLGLALGLGFCAKYHIVLFVPIALAAVITHRRWDILRPSLLLSTIISGLVASAPVWGWNLANDWVSFRFQLSHGLENQVQSEAQRWEQIGSYVGAQLALLSPIVLLFAWRKRESRSHFLLHWLGWSPLLFFLYTSSKATVEANWPIAAHACLLPLGILNDSRRMVTKIVIGIWALASAAVVIQASFPEQPLLTKDPKTLKTWEFIRFREVRDRIKTLKTVRPDSQFFASSYQMAGDLSHHFKFDVPKLRGLNRRDFFDDSSMSLPQTKTFFVYIEASWPWPFNWPAWLGEQGYHPTESQLVGEFREVHFEWVAP